jgi:hypothetical protein
VVERLEHGKEAPALLCLLLRSRVGDLDEVQWLVKVVRMLPPLRRVQGEDGAD